MRRLHERLREEWLLAILLAALPVLLWLTPGTPSQTAVRLPELVHWDTLAALAAGWLIAWLASGSLETGLG